MLCREKNRRMFALWVFATVCSLFADLTSSIMLCYGGKLSYFSAAVFLSDLLGELRQERQAGERSRKASFRTAAVLLAALLSAETGIAAYRLFAPAVKIERAELAAETFAQGPMKGVRSFSAFRAFYDRVDADLDKIAKNTGSPFYTASLFPYAYVYLDLPVGIYSTYYLPADPTERTLLYWQLHPENRPEYIYILLRSDDPTYAEELVPPEENLALFDTLFRYDRTEGNEGLILHITEWYDRPETPE